MNYSIYSSSGPNRAYSVMSSSQLPSPYLQIGQPKQQISSTASQVNQHPPKFRSITPNDQFPCFSCSDQSGVSSPYCKSCEGKGWVYGDHPLVRFVDEIIDGSLTRRKNFGLTASQKRRMTKDGQFDPIEVISHQSQKFDIGKEVWAKTHSELIFAGQDNNKIFSEFSSSQIGLENTVSKGPQPRLSAPALNSVLRIKHSAQKDSGLNLIDQGQLANLSGQGSLFANQLSTIIDSADLRALQMEENDHYSRDRAWVNNKVVQSDSEQNSCNSPRDYSEEIIVEVQSPTGSVTRPYSKGKFFSSDPIACNQLNFLNSCSENDEIDLTQTIGNGPRINQYIPPEEKACKTSHDDYFCDYCKQEPLIGYRYQCKQCEDYSLCSRCYRMEIHQHKNFMVCKEYHME